MVSSRAASDAFLPEELLPYHAGHMTTFFGPQFTELKYCMRKRDWYWRGIGAALVYRSHSPQARISDKLPVSH